MPLNLSIFNKALNVFNDRRIKSFTSLSGSSKALLFSMFKESCLLLCSSEDSADEFYKDTAFWSEALGVKKPVLIQPKGEPLRLKNLKSLYNPDNTKFIASVEAALSPIWHRDKFPLLRLENNSAAGRDSVIETLRGYGYISVPIVSQQGEIRT